MKKYYILSILSIACLTFNVQAEEENSCFADTYAERARTEMEESSYESSDEFEDLETASSCASEEEVEAEAEEKDDAEAEAEAEVLEEVEVDSDVALADAGDDAVEAAQTSASNWLETNVLRTTANLNE